MSGGGGIFGGLAALDNKIQDILDPITRYVDPIGTQTHRVIADQAMKAFNPQPKAAQAATTSGQNQASAAGSRAVAETAAAGGGTGAGAKDLVTQPPNTPEGDRMRLSKMQAIAGGTNTLLGN